MELPTLIFLSCVLFTADAYKVLLSFSMPVRSINILGEGFVRHLVAAGHEVTYITAYPIKDAPKGLRQIDVSSTRDVFKGDSMLNIGHILQSRMVEGDIIYLQQLGLNGAIATFQNENLQKFLEDTTETFDVVIADYLESEIYAAFAALYDCPMIWAYSMGAHWVALRLIDAPAHPAYSMDYLTPHIPPFTFLQRVEQLWMQIKWTFYKETITIHAEEALYKEVFGPLLAKRGRALPNYRDVIYNASMMLSNEHHAAGHHPSTPQNFKFIGGNHIETPTKPLPKDLQNLMDNAKHGVIYFSMGSTWQSKDIPIQVKESLLRMFGELKETVIWKHEEPLQNVPSNVHIVHWAPQPSILAHPNLLLFITHGGYLSSIEALHFGVPIIGVPIYFDQFININKAVMKGYALMVELNITLADNLREPIQKMLKDSRYRTKTKELSAIYHNRPVPPGKELVHWVEHVVLTHGAPHLGSPALHVPLYQKMYLDLLAVIFAVFTAIYMLLKNLCGGQRKKNIKKKRN